MVKFPVDAIYEITANGKKPKDLRVEVNAIHSGNIDDWLGTQLYHRLVYANGSWRSIEAVPHNQIPVDIHIAMEYIRDNDGKTPEGVHLYLIAENNEHGGIPGDKKDVFWMDILCLMDNNDKNNLRRQGDGIGETIKHYTCNKILHRSIPEPDLIPMWDRVDINKTNRHLQKRQFFYATCREVIASFLIWKVIANLFRPKTYYLLTPNLLWLLTRMDTNEYVQNNRGNNNYYRQDWDGPVNLDGNRIQEIIANGLQSFVPLFKLVHYEYDKVGKLHIFFQKCGTRASNDGKNWFWANYWIAGSIEMCVSSLGWVSSSGISPVMIKRDPAVHEGRRNGRHDGVVEDGCAMVSLSGHKYTLGNKHNNGPYRVTETNPGSQVWVYPGGDKLVPRKTALLDNWAGLTQKLQGLGARLIQDDQENNEEVALLEELINKLESRLE